MTNLKAVNQGENTWCGPAVLSVFTGRDTDYCANILSQISGRSKITYVETEHLIKAFERMRCDVKDIKFSGTTLYGVLSGLAQNRNTAKYAVLVTKYVVAIEVNDGKVYICDNHTKEPMNAIGSARLSQRVVKVLEVTPRGEPLRLDTIIEVNIQSKYYPLISINRKEVYGDERDNDTKNIGTIRFKDKEELAIIMQKLQEIIKND